MIKLIVDYDEDNGLYYFFVEQDGETVHFRPGFRSRDEAERVGDAWVRTELGAKKDV